MYYMQTQKIKIVKITKTVEYFQSTCLCCDKVIQGQTEFEVEDNMKRHFGSKSCKKKK